MSLGLLGGWERLRGLSWPRAGQLQLIARSDDGFGAGQEQSQAFLREIVRAAADGAHRAHRVAASVKAGIVWINDHHRLDPASPWGGVGESGIGREFGLESFNDHFNVKSVMVATADKPFDWYRATATQTRLN